MGQRIVYELLGNDPDSWTEVRRTLQQHGASHIAEPQAPGTATLTAVLPDDADPEEVLDQLRALPTVGRAEIDAWRDIL